MSPLSNENYNKIVNVIYTIVSDKLHRINEARISRSLFSYHKHLINKALKFSVAFL